MGYREIPGDKILKFPATPAFKGRRAFFTPESITHPAKMNLRLLSWIIETYTKSGDVVLDPMSGTGSTIILAALAGRHAIAVEYEPRFCDMIRANIKRTKIQSSLMLQGSMVCIQGDARELTNLLEESDAIITSPPYASPGGAIQDRAFMEKLALDPTSNRYGRKTFPGYGKYGESPEQIGNKPYGDIKAIITSPPYGNRLSDEAVQDGDEARMSYRQAIDTIVTSPPYEGSVDAKGDPVRRAERMKEAGLDPKTIVGGTARCGEIDWRYYEDSDNIGNLKSESYLEAMLHVYRECLKVLKPEGVMVLVTKNFIRDKAVVRLDLDTIKLCEAAGFRLSDRWYFKLPQRSFWRILYKRRYPDVPEVEYEDVLVFTNGVNILDKKVNGG